jgi:hypothetical protein
MRQPRLTAVDVAASGLVREIVRKTRRPDAIEPPLQHGRKAQEVHRCNERQRLGSGDFLLLREDVLRLIALRQ